jgi:surface polysaccharide O-acyltransferase-like enzyme
MVVCIHAPFPPQISNFVIPLSRNAVPVFFMITGYYYSYTKERKAERKQLFKLFRLVIVASLLFFAWDLVNCWIANEPISSIFDWINNKKLIQNIVFFNFAPFAGHLWYVNATIYVLLVVFLFEKFWPRQKLYPLIPLLILGNLILGTYAPVLLGQSIKNLVTRNFLFIGLPFFLIGDLIYTRQIKVKATTAMILSLLFGLVATVEGVLLNAFEINGPGEYYFGNTFSAVFAFLFTLQYTPKSNTPYHQALYYIGAKLSTNIYILHPMVIEVLGCAISFFGRLFRPTYGLFYIQPIVAYVTTVIIVWGYQWCIMVFKRKFRSVQYTRNVN